MSDVVSRVNQGRYDSEKSLRDNAINKSRIDVLDSVNQRLKKCHPKIYERLIGPIHERMREKAFKCYCNNPQSLHVIYQEIISGKVHVHSLTCDDCWQNGITKTWGYYGWASKLIPQKTWDALCEKRAYEKFFE